MCSLRLRHAFVMRVRCSELTRSISLSAKALLDAVNFVDQLRSEFNRLGEAARYAVASRFQLVAVVRPLANFPIFYLHDRYASHANWNLSQTSAQKRLSVRGCESPF